MPLALISGASTGIGRATALRLAGNGWTVLAGVRNPAAGEELAAKAGAGKVVPITLDVTDAAQIEAAAQSVAQHGAERGLDALVNNAGVGVGGPLELVSIDDLRRQFEVNVFGHVAVTQALLPALRRASGRIIFVSSIGGRVTTPFIAPYSASKHAVESLGDALRVELRSSNVQVALVEPGSVATPIWDKGRTEAAEFEIPPQLEREYGNVPAALQKAITDTESRGVPPEQVAATIERALGGARMRTRYLVGTDARVQLAISRLLPDRVFDRLIARLLGV